MKNNLTTLRNNLFLTIEKLIDPEPGEENKMDIQTAKVIASCSQTIINSAKLELDYNKHQERLGNNTEGTSFFALKE